MTHGLAPLEEVCLIKNGWMTDFERELWREDPMALDAITHDFWEGLQGVATAVVLSYINLGKGKGKGLQASEKVLFVKREFCEGIVNC